MSQDTYPTKGGKPFDWPLIAMLTLLSVLAVLIFSSCYTQKKAQEQVNKANTKYPAIVATLARDLYPCTDLLKPDTVTLTIGDTIVIIECPDAGNDFTARIDTVRLPGSTKTVRVPVTLPVQTKTITRWYEDSAKLKLGALELTRSMKQVDKLTADLQAMTGKRDWYRRWFWWLIIAVVILGAFSTYKILH